MIIWKHYPTIVNEPDDRDDRDAWIEKSSIQTIGKIEIYPRKHHFIPEFIALFVFQNGGNIV